MPSFPDNERQIGCRVAICATTASEQTELDWVIVPGGRQTSTDRKKHLQI